MAVPHAATAAVQEELRRLLAKGQQRCLSGGLGNLRWRRADQLQAQNPRGRTARGVVQPERHVLDGLQRVTGDNEQRPRDGCAGPTEGFDDAHAEPWSTLRHRVPEGHQHTCNQIVWAAFVGHKIADDGMLLLGTRCCGYQPEEDTLHLDIRLDLRKVHQYMRRGCVRDEEAESVGDFLASDSSHAGHLVFNFEAWPIPSDDTCSGRGHAVAMATGSDEQFRRAGGSTRWLTGAHLSDIRPQGGIEIRPDGQEAPLRVIRKRLA